MTIRSEPILEHPVLVVGVPVYNEARFLQETLTSLASQKWTDFAVLIADNASTDGSDRIAEEMGEKDPRFHLHRHPTNIGALANFKYLRDATRSPLFMWLGGHDVLHPDFLAETIAAHRRNPHISLAYSFIRITDANGDIEHLLENLRVARMLSGPMSRYLHAYRHVCGWEVNHLMRRSALDDYQFGCSVAGDLILLAHLAFKGRFECIPRHLYTARNLYPRVPGHEQTTMERITGQKNFSADDGNTLMHVSDDFTSLARGRPAWRIYRLLLRSIVRQRTRPGGLGLVSAFLRLTAPIRKLGPEPYRKPRQRSEA